MNILKTPFKIKVGNIKDAIKVLLVLSAQKPKYGLQYTVEEFLNYGF